VACGESLSMGFGPLGKVKVKFSLERPMKAEKGSSGIAVLFL
jgi:hypothetical protein